MKIINAIKKLEKNGFKIVPNTHVKNKFDAVKENSRYFISFYEQDGNVICIDARTQGNEDDSMTDYHAGTFCDNIQQAINMCH